MLHTKFRENLTAGSGDFSRVFTIYGPGGHLGHVTSIMSSDFHFNVTERFHKNFWLRLPQKVLRKSGLNFCMYTTLGQGQGQEITLTFNTHIPS